MRAIRYVVAVLGLLAAMVGTAYADVTSTLDAAQSSMFDGINNRLPGLLAAVAALVVVGIVWRLIKRKGKEAGRSV